MKTDLRYMQMDFITWGSAWSNKKLRLIKSNMNYEYWMLIHSFRLFL